MTTLATSAKIATSSLAAVQVQLGVASSNIANADTKGYTSKSANASTAMTSGVGTGVSVETITSKVSQILIKQLASATSETAAADKIASYMDQLQTAMGRTTGSDDAGTSLSNKIADVESALADLINTPESATLAHQVLATLEELTTAVSDLSSDVQSLRSQADSDIAANVDAANDLLNQLDSLNTEIQSMESRGMSSANLVDQRNQALVELSEYIDVTSFTGSNGSLKVYTTTGQVLLDSSAHLLTFKESSSVSADRTFDGTNSGLSGISIDGNDVTNEFRSGSISALVELRDETLPGVQDMLDNLASNLITSFDAIQPGLLEGTDATDIKVGSTFLADVSLLVDDTSGTLTPSEVADGLLKALQGDTSFGTAGTLAARETDFASYASDILSSVVSSANSATSQLEVAQTELSAVSDTISSLYGVNVDEETARLSELEQLYSVASQILSILQEMFDDLIAAVQ
ncbi:flagellar hook-associated protein FlgK [Roseibium sp.]|uniref:flagellar hook-associated protein FlgK n=1 Tax=Roseibium sp. TaxID=1936156 RepID=UPI003A96C900